MNLPDPERPVFFFDGVCNLCNRSVQFIIKHDRKGRFLFASLQSPAGQKIREHILQEEGAVPDSLVLSYKGKYYTRSAAALRAAWLLGGVWRMLSAGLIIPAFIRNGIYDTVAKNRYKWFGKQDACMVPTRELKARFLPE